MSLKELIASPADIATHELLKPGRVAARQRRALAEACTRPDGLPKGISAPSVARLIDADLLTPAIKSEGERKVTRYIPTSLGYAVHARLSRADAAEDAK